MWIQVVLLCWIVLLALQCQALSLNFIEISENYYFLQTGLSTTTDRFSFYNCHSTGAIRFSNVSLTPEPIIVPGIINITYNLQILRPINNEQFQLKITALKKVLFGYVPLPCGLEKFGLPPCTLPACNIFDFTIFIPLRDVSKILPYTCPLAEGNFYIPPTPIAIGKNQSKSPFQEMLKQGHYKIHAELKDTMTGEIVGCFNIQVSLSQVCSGISCLIGWNKILK